MNKLLSFLIFIVLTSNAHAQNVGIGTNTPNQRLDVNGRMRLRHTPNTTPGIWLNKADNTDASFVGQINDTTFGVWDALTSSWRFAMNHSNSWMGIGTSTPRFPLTFASTVGDKISLWGGSSSPAANHYGLGVQGSLLQIYTPTSGDDIAFGTGRSGSFTENMRIKGNGRVGIGTSTPTADLTVNGNVRIVDGTQGNGKVLTSDASGNASWRTSSGSDRFMITFIKSGSVSYTTRYNTGFTIGSNGSVTIQKSGYYHFEGQADIHTQNGPDYTQNSSTAAFGSLTMSVVLIGDFTLDAQKPFYKTVFSIPNFGTTTNYDSFTKGSLEIYLTAGTQFQLSVGAPTTATYDGYFSGYLVSE